MRMPSCTSAAQRGVLSAACSAQRAQRSVLSAASRLNAWAGQRSDATGGAVSRGLQSRVVGSGAQGQAAAGRACCWGGACPGGSAISRSHNSVHFRGAQAGEQPCPGLAGPPTHLLGAGDHVEPNVGGGAGLQQPAGGGAGRAGEAGSPQAEEASCSQRHEFFGAMGRSSMARAGPPAGRTSAPAAADWRARPSLGALT